MKLIERWRRWWLSPLGEAVYDALEEPGWVSDQHHLRLRGPIDAKSNDVAERVRGVNVCALWIANGVGYLRLEDETVETNSFGFWEKRVLWAKIKREQNYHRSVEIRLGLLKRTQ